MGLQVAAHWTGQPLWSWGLVASGVVCLIIALLPSSWIQRAAVIRPHRPRTALGDLR